MCHLWLSISILKSQKEKKNLFNSTSNRLKCTLFGGGTQPESWCRSGEQPHWPWWIDVEAHLAPLNTQLEYGCLEWCFTDRNVSKLHNCTLLHTALTVIVLFSYFLLRPLLACWAHSLPPSLPPPLPHSFTHSLPPLLLHSLPPSLTLSLIHSITLLLQCLESVADKGLTSLYWNRFLLGLRWITLATH